jgi:hypothetical protein
MYFITLLVSEFLSICHNVYCPHICFCGHRCGLWSQLVLPFKRTVVSLCLQFIFFIFSLCSMHMFLNSSFASTISIDNSFFFVLFIIRLACDSFLFAARILRAVRIAARLGFRFTRETAHFIKNLSRSLLRLDNVLK